MFSPIGEQQSNVKAVPRIIQLYLVFVVLAGLGIVFILHEGSRLSPPPGSPPQGTVVTEPEVVSGLHPQGHRLADAVLARLGENAKADLTRFFLQLLIVITVSYSIGWVFTKIGQPAVVGEMMAGVLLGPSFFGWLAPSAFHFVFVASSLEPLHLFSQIGVCLFMFAVGMDMDLSEIRQKAHAALVISHVSIILPALFGITLAYVFYQQLAQPGAPFISFALFTAISMSITAFPVLVRILQDRGVLKTPLGRTAAACAAIGDVTAWGLLAFVVAFASSGDFAATASCFGLVLLFVAIMFYVVRPNLPRWLGAQALARDQPKKSVLAIVIAIVLACALTTQMIGIRALFGSFVAGLVMPATSGFRAKLGVRVENVSSVLLLPVFFAFSGLRTQIGLLHDRSDWLIGLLIILLATAGKFAGTALSARVAGIKWRESFQLGALMNTRGLMELIALNLGYELGILSQRVFSMLVLMALTTTILTGPLLTLFGSKRRNPDLMPTALDHVTSAS
jgi:Kef-type K+ transport system membrane component KefB